jgi:pimeloyl-ACP methyl ester carboxylesterase
MVVLLGDVAAFGATPRTRGGLSCWFAGSGDRGRGRRDAWWCFLATLRSVVGVGGQSVDASDRHYLSEGFPVLIIWGARDPIIPVRHGERAHEAIPGSRLEILEGVGHLPQLEAPGRFVRGT